MGFILKKNFRTNKIKLLFVKLKALNLSSARIAQIIFSDVEKYFKYLSHDDWFDIVTYLSNPHDGARSYHQQNPWLECFILPWESKTFSDGSEVFQSAYIKYELAPSEFIERIEGFSKLLQTRDLCKLLIERLADDIDEDKTCLRLQFWMSLQAEILEIVQPGRSSSSPFTTQSHNFKSFK